MYLDSSALVKLVLEEEHSAILGEYVSTIAEPVSSIITAVEVPRAVRRSDPSAVPRATEVLERVQLIEIDQAILEQAARLDPAQLKSADAIHLASALRFGSSLSTFVTYDHRLGLAAARNGVHTSTPA